MIKFNDDCVSFVNSEIVYKDSKLHIFDKNSTYGTLRLAKKNEDLKNNIFKTFIYKKFAF